MAANPLGASVGESAKRIQAILSEPEQPTDMPQGDTTPKHKPDEAVDTESNVSETLEGDTEKPSRRRKLKQGDREIEIEVITEDIDPDEVAKGLMMEADYRKKTMAHSEEVKAKQQEFEAKQSDLDAAISEARELLMMEAEDLQSPEMIELKEIDPDAYDKKVLQLEKKAKKLEARHKKRQEDLLEKQKQHILEAQKKWAESIPDWLDENKRADDLGKMETYLKGQGWNDQKISSTYLPEDLSMIRKAMLYDQIQSQDLSDKRVKPALKSSKPSSAAAKEETLTEAKKVVNNAKKTGRRKDAQAAILKILGG